jgi:hypothetical protein
MDGVDLVPQLKVSGSNPPLERIIQVWVGWEKCRSREKRLQMLVQKKRSFIFTKLRPVTWAKQIDLQNSK